MENRHVHDQVDDRRASSSLRVRLLSQRRRSVRRVALGTLVLLAAAAPVLAFSMAVSSSSRTSLLPALQIGAGRAPTPTTIAASTTTTVPSQHTTKQQMTKQVTTVVEAIPTIVVEDDQGRRIEHLRAQPSASATTSAKNT